MMIPVQLVVLVSALAWTTNAHYRFSHLLVNQTETSEWQYVRDVTPDANFPALPSVPQLLKMTPQYPPDIFNKNIRCGRDAWIAKPNGTDRLTQMADVIAGSEVGFRIGTNFQGREPWTFHEGPGQVYLSPSPSGTPLSLYEGDGDYFKIAHIGAISATAWGLLYPPGKIYNKDRNFTIPATTPPGPYLMRIEHLYPHEGNKTQIFVNCAQINIIGNGGGTPRQLARFPGTYKLTDPGINIPAGTEEAVYADYRKYGPAPGPPVWTG